MRLLVSASLYFFTCSIKRSRDFTESQPFLKIPSVLPRLIAGVVPAEKFLHSSCVAERFRAATAGGGECSAQVSIGQARR